MECQPPIIDVTGLTQRDDAALRRVAAALVAPCERWGLFHITGHGIAESSLLDFTDAMRGFFALPASEKAALRRTRDNAWGYYDEELTKNQRDWKEVFDYGARPSPEDTATAHSDGVNQWPGDDAAFRDRMLHHHSSCHELGRALLRALCVSLELDPDSLTPYFTGDSSFVRLNHYAPCPEPAAPDAPRFPDQGHLGVHHHTDAGALTLLLQDDVAGLQAEVDGRWYTVEPVPAAFTVNLGDMLQVWSNDRYRSPLHRVVVNRERSRYSAPFFLNPRYDTVCAPLPALLREGAPARFRPVSWSHFRDQRSAGDYADYGAEIQIEDYRITDA